VPPLIGREIAATEGVSTVLLLENQGRLGLVARPITLADGRPLVLGVEGCSPSGVEAPGGGGLDLLVGADDGHVGYYRRDQLRW